jgi:adenylate kinase
MIISISGTPATGKTYLAKKIAKDSKGQIEYFDLNKYIKDNKLYDSYDKKDKTYDVDIESLKSVVNPTLKKNMSKNKTMDLLVGKTLNIKKLLESINKITKNKEFDGIIVDSHLSHYLDSDYCIIVKSDIKTLSKRLKARKYSGNKIQDNIESEIFEVCLDEARKLKRNVIIVEN